MSWATDVRQLTSTSHSSHTHRMLSALPPTALLLDLVVIGASVLAAGQLRETGFLLDTSATVADLTVLGTVIALGWVMMIALRGGYDEDVFGAGVDEFKRVARATAMTAAAVGIGCFLLKYSLSRGFFVLAFTVGLVGLLTSRLVLRKALQRVRRQGHLRKHVLLVGSTGSTDEIARVLQRETWLGYEVLGALTPTTELDVETRTGVPVLGNADEVVELAPRLGADLVILAGGGVASSAHMRRLMWALESEDVHVVVAPSVTDVSRERVKVRPVGGLPLIHLEKPRAAAALNRAKRVFDVVVAGAVLAAVSPLLLFAALRVRLHDGGPVLFRQERVGQDGSTFSCLKLRTMVTDAEDRLAALHQQQNHTHGLFKMADDPRVTSPGRWLRRFSVDELPQLWNVVRGDMSLVGPRPPLAREVALYDLDASRRLRVRPGLTGLWQVSGRSNLAWDEAIRLDVYYVDNWSMLQDLNILAKTVRAVLRPEGAY